MANKKTRKRFTGYSIYDEDASGKSQGFGGALGRVGKDIYKHLEENPLDITYAIGGAGIAKYFGGKVIKSLAKKLPKISKKIRTKYGRTDFEKKKFTGTKDKSAVQQAEARKGKYEKVVTETKTKTTTTPTKKRVKVVDKKGKAVRYKTGPNKGNIKYKQVAGKPKKKTEKYTEAGFEPNWLSVASKQKGTAFGTGVGAGILAATYKKAKASNVPKAKAWTTTGEDTGGAFRHKGQDRVTMRRSPVDGGNTNFATGGKLNNVAATSPDSKRNKDLAKKRKLQDWATPKAPKMINEEENKAANKYKSVTSNYKSTPDHRGTRVESDTPRRNVSPSKSYSPTNYSAQVNGSKGTVNLSERFRKRLGGKRNPRTGRSY